MAISTITWNVFLESIKRKETETVQGWLSRWVFDNEGAALIGECASNKKAPVSLEKKQFVLVLMTRGKWQTTIH